MKTTLLIISALFFTLFTTAQTVELEEDVRLLDIKKPTRGQNLRHYNHWYLEYGSIIPVKEDPGAKVKSPFAFSFSAGNRYKLKLNNYFAVGLGAAYSYTSFRLKQDAQKQIPNNITHRKEKYIFHALAADAFFRINFGKRGNIVGKFIDLGGYGSYAFSAKHEYEDKIKKPQMAGYTDTRQTNTGLQYINRLNYGATVRMGINRYVLFGRYRISEIFDANFKTQVSKAELARITVGVQIGLH